MELAPGLLEIVDRLAAEHQYRIRDLIALEEDIAKEKIERDQLQENLHLFEEVRVFLEELTETTRNEIMEGLEKVVTLCLQITFGPELSFEIDVDTQRHSTAVTFYVVDTSGEEALRAEPEENMGGGVVDAAAIGLRYGLLKILNPSPLGPMFLDEPAKMVSGDLVENIGKLLKQLKAIFNKQTNLVTHHESLIDIVDNPIRVRRINGVSICEPVYSEGAKIHESK